MGNEKHCPKYDKVNPAKDFWKDKRATIGLQTYCWQCMKKDKPSVHLYKTKPKQKPPIRKAL